MAWKIRTTTSLILLLLSQVAVAQSLDAYLDNRSGVKHMLNKQNFQAYQDFLKAIEKEPLNPDLQMNLGLTLQMSEDLEKAEKAFMSAYDLSKGDKPREFMALFDLGNLRAQKEDLDGALQAYQKALDIAPDSLEVKTNIELLMKSGKGKGKGKGKGNGKGQGQDDDKNGDNKENKDKKDGEVINRREQPRTFEGKDLTKENVRKILDEIQNQENTARAKEYGKKAKERPNDKDW